MLNEALKIKNLVIKNRIAIPPMVCFNWTDENGYVTEKNIEHYRDLAKGGAGLVIVEAALVDPAFANHVINGDREEGHCLHCKNFCKWNPNEMANPNVKCPGFEKYNRA